MLLDGCTISHHTSNQLNQKVGTDTRLLGDLLSGQTHYYPSMTIEQMITKHITTRLVVDRLASCLAVRLIYLYIDTDARGTSYHQRQIGIIWRLLVGSDDTGV